MKKRKLAAKTTEESSLPELQNRLERASPGVVDRPSVDKALLELITRLSSVANECTRRNWSTRASAASAPQCRRVPIAVSMSAVVASSCKE